MSLPSKRKQHTPLLASPLDDQHDLSTSALIRRDAESTNAPPPSTTHPPPPKRPRTSLPATVPSTGPTSATSATSLIPTPLSLIQRSFASAQTRTYTRLSLAEIQRLPVDTVAAYAHALQRALDITAHGFNEKLRDQDIAQEAAEELRQVSSAVYTLLNVPVQDLEREVERVAEMAYDVSNDLDNPDLEDLERNQVLSRLDYKATYGDSLYKTAAALAPLGRWHDEREVRWMRSRVCMNVLEQMKWWPEFRNKTQMGRWRYYGSPCSRRLLLELLGLGNFRGAQWAPGPLQQQDDSDDDAGQWRCKSLPLAKWKEVMGYLEKEIPGEGTLTVRGPNIYLYFSQETFEYRLGGQYGL